MDKNAIKKYAVWARNELIARVSQKAQQYGITEKNIVDAKADSVNGILLSDTEKKQRQALIKKIETDGYEQVMEEVAYTWFNRFTALRFMEVNNYLPSHTRVFTNEDNAFKPQILAEAISLDLDGLDMDKVFVLKDANKDEELYKYLLIVQCNALSSVLPGMFQKIADYTELLLPDYLLREGSVIEQMITLIPENDWTEQVQIIGWLYQYYISQKKDDVFAALKKNVKITKENIPAATQLFTPDWIVRYMVENSLGRLWVEGHPNEELKAQWKYYLEEAEQEPEVEKQLKDIRKEYAALKPEDIHCIDPCSGSGHILAYMFDVLVQIYESYGYNSREAVASIVENNIYGLDIDERAAQLASFSIMMKARQYDRRFLTRGIQPHVYAIEESNHVDRYALEYFCNNDPKLIKAMNTIVKEMHDAKEYGSIISVSNQDWDLLYARFDEIENEIHMYTIPAMGLKSLVKVAQTLAQKYHVTATNPPYMSSASMTSKLSEYVRKFYPSSKSDLFAVFIESCAKMVYRNYYQTMITQHAWMFLTSFENLRQSLLRKDIVNMSHLGARAFEEIGGEVVQTTSFVMRNSNIESFRGIYCRLIEPTTQKGKEEAFLSGENRYIASQTDFCKVPGNPFAYWVSSSFISAFENSRLGDVAFPKTGFTTGNNDDYLRLWFEVSSNKINKKWFYLNKGGTYRKWYGNNEYVVDWENDGMRIRNNKGSTIRNPDFYFKEGVTWSKITSYKLSGRYSPSSHIFDAVGLTCFTDDRVDLNFILALFCSDVSSYFLSVLNPTLSMTTGAVANLPVIYSKNMAKVIHPIVDENIQMSKDDWDAFETSWDFPCHPLILAVTKSEIFPDRKNVNISECYRIWEKECEERFNHLKNNEVELNERFINIYGLQNELSSEVEDKDVTIRKADLQRDIKSLISYAVGCMLGRYSIDCKGLVYAGGEWDSSKYTTFAADKDNIIPICDDEYFEDDIVARFVKFIEAVYGKNSLESNLKFIADALGGKGHPRDVIRNYFMNDFYADHLKIYQKRPIYWLFDSGKKNGFKCLIYMHRYQPDTIARIRTDYVHEQQSRYHTAIADLENRIASASTSERVKLNKRLKTIQDQADELRVYEEKIHHLADQMIPIDLDDGVKVNYAKFRDVLAKIK